MPDWDKAYREAANPLFGEAPTDFVRAMSGRAGFTAATALCLADGDGRNGRWLARQGLTVTAVDISEVATAQALERDAASGLSVERIVADLAAWQPAEDRRWDAVFVVFLQCPSSIRNPAIVRACQALQPGGWLIAEGFARQRSGRGSLGPSAPELLYDLAELEAAAHGLTVVEAMQGLALLDEGSRHRGYGDVVRFIARKE